MHALERMIAAVAPHICLGCGREGALVCAWCQPELASPPPPRCYKCHAFADASKTCASCHRKTSLEHVWVATELDKMPQRLVHAFKFERAQAAATPIAACMHEQLPYFEDAFIVPVPTATSRIRARGYDHTRLLARCLSRLCGLPALSVLARHGQARQVGAARQERLIQLSGSFRVVRPRLASGSHIILIDDVLTTGATLEEAARTLKRAGARHVDGLVFAQKM